MKPNKIAAYMLTMALPLQTASKAAKAQVEFGDGAPTAGFPDRSHNRNADWEWIGA